MPRNARKRLANERRSNGSRVPRNNDNGLSDEEYKHALDDALATFLIAPQVTSGEIGLLLMSSSSFLIGWIDQAFPGLISIGSPGGWWDVEGQATMKGVAMMCLVLLTFRRGTSARGGTYFLIGLIVNSAADVTLAKHRMGLALGLYIIGLAMVVCCLLEYVFYPLSGALHWTWQRMLGAIAAWPLIGGLFWMSMEHIIKNSEHLLLPMACYFFLVALLASLAWVPLDLTWSFRASIVLMAIAESLRCTGSVMPHRIAEDVFWPVYYFAQMGIVLSLVHYRLPKKSFDHFSQYVQTHIKDFQR